MVSWPCFGVLGWLTGIRYDGYRDRNVTSQWVTVVRQRSKSE